MQKMQQGIFLDIQLIETDVLLKELVNRFDHAVFIGIRLDTLVVEIEVG